MALFSRNLVRLRMLSVCFALVSAGFSLSGANGVPPGRLSFKLYGADQGLGSLSLWALAQDGLGFIWVGTENGLYRFDGQRFQVFGVAEGLSSAFVNALHVDSEGTLWVGTYKGLSYLSEGRFQEVGASAGLPPGQVIGISTGPDGQIWVGMTEGVFRRLKDGRFQAVPGWPGGVVTALWSHPGREVWVASWVDSRATLLRWDLNG